MAWSDEARRAALQARRLKAQSNLLKKPGGGKVKFWSNYIGAEVYRDRYAKAVQEARSLQRGRVSYPSRRLANSYAKQHAIRTILRKFGKPERA